MSFDFYGADEDIEQVPGPRKRKPGLLGAPDDYDYDVWKDYPGGDAGLGASPAPAPAPAPPPPSIVRIKPPPAPRPGWGVPAGAGFGLTYRFDKDGAGDPALDYRPHLDASGQNGAGRDPDINYSLDQKKQTAELYRDLSGDGPLPSLGSVNLRLDKIFPDHPTTAELIKSAISPLAPNWAGEIGHPALRQRTLQAVEGAVRHILTDQRPYDYLNRAQAHIQANGDQPLDNPQYGPFAARDSAGAGGIANIDSAKGSAGQDDRFVATDGATESRKPTAPWSGEGDTPSMVAGISPENQNTTDGKAGPLSILDWVQYGPEELWTNPKINIGSPIEDWDDQALNKAGFDLELIRLIRLAKSATAETLPTVLEKIREWDRANRARLAPDETDPQGARRTAYSREFGQFHVHLKGIAVQSAKGAQGNISLIDRGLLVVRRMANTDERDVINSFADIVRNGISSLIDSGVDYKSARVLRKYADRIAEISQGKSVDPSKTPIENAIALSRAISDHFKTQFHGHAPEDGGQFLQRHAKGTGISKLNPVERTRLTTALPREFGRGVEKFGLKMLSDFLADSDYMIIGATRHPTLNVTSRTLTGRATSSGRPEATVPDALAVPRTIGKEQLRNISADAIEAAKKTPFAIRELKAGAADPTSLQQFAMDAFRQAGLPEHFRVDRIPHTAVPAEYYLRSIDAHMAKQGHRLSPESLKILSKISDNIRTSLPKDASMATAAYAILHATYSYIGLGLFGGGGQSNDEDEIRR